MVNTTSFRIMNECIDLDLEFETAFKGMYDFCSNEVHTYAVLFRNKWVISDFISRLNIEHWTVGNWWRIKDLDKNYHMLEFENGSKIHLIAPTVDPLRPRFEFKGLYLDDILLSPTVDPDSEFVQYIKCLIRYRYHPGDTQVRGLEIVDVDIATLFG